MADFFGRFTAYDASATDNLVCKGYKGAVTDGQFVYFVPFHNGAAYHGVVLRLQLRNPFKEAGSWAAFDAGAVAGLITRGYQGAVFDGRYIYFAPHYNGNSYHGIVLRLDTSMNFKDTRAWAAYDAGSVGGLVTRGYFGGCFDGQYVYFAPHYQDQGTFHGNFLRYDAGQPFKAPASWEAFKAENIDGLTTIGYQGAAFDGQYVYFSPRGLGFNDAGWLKPHGNVLRYDTSKPFKDPRSWTAFGLATLNKYATGFALPAADDNYLYLPPATVQSEKLFAARYNRQKPFKDPGSWEIFNLNDVDGYANGYSACFLFGKHLALAATYRKIACLDLELPFSEASSWTVKDAYFTDQLQTYGYTDVVGDGVYFYFAPLGFSASMKDSHGIVLRLRREPCPGQEEPLPGREDLTKYAEDDLNNVISRSSSRATVYNVSSSDDIAFLYRDYGTGAFEELEVDFDVRLTAVSGRGEGEATHGVLTFSNKCGALQDPPYTSEPAVIFYVEFGEEGVMSRSLALMKRGGGAWYYPISTGITYYCKLQRLAASMDTVTLYVYSDISRTNLLAALPTIGYGGGGSSRRRYIYAVWSGRDGVGSDRMSYYIENINVIRH